MLRTGKNTCTSPRCDARAAGTGSRCTLPEGHAAPHTAAGDEWPSDASQRAERLAVLEMKIGVIAKNLSADATIPEAAHDPTELLRWFEEEFPWAFPNAEKLLARQARRLTKV